MSSNERTTLGFEQLLNFMREAVKRGWIPGFSAVSVSSDHTDYAFEGYQSVWPSKEKLQKEAIYDVASLTKVMITTTLVLQLVEEKKINLHDPIKNYLPEFIHSEVTVTDLLLHQSGLPADIQLNPEWAKEKYRQVLMNCPLQNKGETLYSDIGFILLGWMVEAVTGQPLLTLSEERIVRPLNLQDSGYNLKRPVKQFVPTEKRETGLKRGTVHDSKAACLNGVSGHAGWFTTIRDSACFLKGLLRIDLSSNVFPSKYVEWMTHFANGKRTLGWEWRESSTGDKYLYHTGFTGVYMYVNLTKKRGGVILTNSIHPYKENPYKENRNTIIHRMFTEGIL